LEGPYKFGNELICGRMESAAYSTLGIGITPTPHPLPCLISRKTCIGVGHYFRCPLALVLMLKHCRLLSIVGITLSVLLLNAVTLQAQSSQGELSVTTTIIGSVGVTMSPERKPTVIVANLPDPRDNISRLLPTGPEGTGTDKNQRSSQRKQIITNEFQ
jgi:hypothetical protein